MAPRELYTLEEKFQACVDIIQTMPKQGPVPTTYVEMLTMYSLYKQATLGPCETSQPAFWRIEERYKWDSWHKLGDMDPVEAMETYVAGVLEKIDYCAEHCNWNEMMVKYKKEYDEFEPKLRKQFRIIDRELVTEDGTFIPRTSAPKEPLPEGEYSLEEKFRACVTIIQSLPKSGPVPTSYAEMLTMYGLYKQATEGPCTGSQPFWNIVERFKWDAWNRMGELDKSGAMELYVEGVLEKVDYCSENWDWDEMMTAHAKDYDKLQPILREKFRIIDRELIKEDGTQERRAPTKRRTTGVLSFNPNRAKTREISVEIPKDEQINTNTHTPDDPCSDAEYCDALDHRSLSRSSSFSLEDPEQSPGRVRSLNAYCARMDVELRAINSTLNTLTAASDSRHNSLLALIKHSATFISVPSRLSWRALFFFLIWPFVVHWAIRRYGGHAAFIQRIYAEFDICSALATVEFITNCFAQAAMVIAVHSIAADKHLHGNFKFVLCMALSRTFLNGVRRSVANYLTVFWTDDISPEFMTFYKHVSMFTSTLLSISMPFVAIERLLYTYNIANYETRKVSHRSLTCCAAIVILASVGVAVFDNSAIPLSFKFVAPVFTLTMMCFVYRENLKRRHSELSTSLDEKALARRNMNACSVMLFLPPMICTSVFSIITGILMLRKVVVLAEEFGYGETTFNSVVGLSVAFDSLLTPTIAYGCHRLLKIQCSRVASELRNFNSESNDYFRQLDKSWNIRIRHLE
ncbi:hypothetical protein PRIPAC_79305 [Pristionchus pacificus]|uniref:Uncharacterized protein n=1 Tax=Pristionchus pacificus TaxID=54126 RepID=A0A2A6CJH3_PRIPA|nr:hypothetical protein PRIPAC_79305 [Pristionchus pacificus]|eukprot:PDM78227.1 hypothetical protein PRIPAC_30806 [Pristionchus pacificus]